MDESRKKEIKHELKEETYTKYTSLIQELIGKEYYKDFPSTLSTFLALTMSAEATKKNLMKMGAESKDVEAARTNIISEIWHLMELYENGTITTLMEKDAQEKEQQREKK